MKYEGFRRTVNMPKWYDNTPAIDTGLLTKVYLGVVKDARDPQRMGRLMVWIPELSGDPNLPENWVLCSYCSPFAGATFFDIGIHTDKDVNSDSVRAQKQNAAHRTPNGGNLPDSNRVIGRQSYGMWFTPPDIGNEVLVTFINGDPNRAVWFGCLYHQDTNHMVPGVAKSDIFGLGEEGPVIEHDARDGFNPNSPKRREYEPLYDGLLAQGLNEDEARGQSTSSAKREAPSQVFGVLTPNGNSFVMDDLPDTELIRLRTKSGVQLLLDETNGFIYMISKDGKSWLELSNEGNVDIYGESSVSIHGEKVDVNLKAGQDINMQAERNINIKGNDVKIEAEGVFHVTSGADIRVTASDSLSMSSEDVVAIYAENEMGLTAGKDLFEQARNVFMNSGFGPQPVAAEKPDSRDDVPGPAERSPTTQTAGENYPSGENIVGRVPQHEPWELHKVSSRGTNNHIVESEPGNERPGATSATATKPNDITQPDGKRFEGEGYNNNVPQYAEVGDVPEEALEPTSKRQISQKGLDIIKQFEGTENCIYQDVAGLDTIGTGHLITAEEKASGRFADGCISDAEADQLLLEDVDRTQKAIRGCVKQPLTQEQYDALTSMAFNIGPSAFCSSTLVKRINAGNYQAVPNEMMRWTKARQNGVLVVNQGLVNRRRAEAQLFAQAPSTDVTS